MRAYLFYVILLFVSLNIFAQDKSEFVKDSIQIENERAYQIKVEEQRKVGLIAFKALDPDSVKDLDLSSLGLKEMPDIHSFAKIKELEIQGNDLIVFNSKELNSPSLRTINLSENNWEKIRFRVNDSIKVLKLNDCGLGKIPRSIRKLKSLKRLELNKNQIQKVPRFISKMDSLEEININFNAFDINERDIKRLKGLEIIQLIGNDLSVLPINMNELQSVKKMNLSMNNLSSLPEGMADMPKIESLIFYKNNFDSIPAIIFSLSTLTELDFYYNNIRIIPPQIENLEKLEMLFISYNQIEHIPESIKDLENLRKLYIHHNLLIGLPPWIVDFKKLEVLDVGYNKLVALPEFSRAISLKEVDIQENNISEIPWSILNLPNLERVFLKENPFEVTEEETNEFRELVEELMEKGVRVSF